MMSTNPIIETDLFVPSNPKHKNEKIRVESISDVWLCVSFETHYVGISVFALNRFIHTLIV
jgi:hypothetical protein